MIMIDLETASQNVTDAAILSVGACRFNLESKEIFDEFYININLESSLKAGLNYSRDTMQFWKRQKPEVLASLFKNTVKWEDAIPKVYDYIKSGRNELIWAWGINFDLPILEANFRKYGYTEMPWDFWNVADARTLQTVLGVKIARSEGHHNSLQDAIDQARYLIEILT